jgi:hypothetical protein
MRPTGAETEKMGLELKVGPDEISVQKKAAATQQLSQVTLNKQMKEYCACKRQQSLIQKKDDEKEAAKPKGDAAPAAEGNATAGNATNATAPAKEVDLDALKCTRPANTTGLECNLDG